MQESGFKRQLDFSLEIAAGWEKGFCRSAPPTYRTVSNEETTLRAGKHQMKATREGTANVYSHKVDVVYGPSEKEKMRKEVARDHIGRTQAEPVLLSRPIFP